MGSTERHATFEDLDSLSAAAAELIGEASRGAITERGRFVVALAGGSTPRRLYALLAEPAWRDQLDWARWHVFLGDERMAPLDDQQSNFRMAHDALLAHVPIPAAQIHRPRTDLGDAAATARDYEARIRAFFGDEPETPRFDLVLLGMGSDGHTASLFPGKPALAETEQLVVASPPGVLPPAIDRITFTFPLLNAARAVCFLVAGADKAPALEAMRSAADPARPPAARVRPTDGHLHWLLDAAAGAAAPG
jgi:6-phosphogluconolactonase